jgi:hypothetical protein
MRAIFVARRLIMGGLLLSGSILPVTAQAGSDGGLWMLLGDGDRLEAGSAPNRVMHFAYASNIRDLTDPNAKISEITKNPDPKTIDARLKAIEIAEMDVVEIFESPSAPGFKMLTMQFQCTKKMYRIAKAEAKERNSLHRFTGATEWQQYVPTDWQSRAYFIACFPEVWTPLAKAEMQEMGRTKAATKQQELREYGVGMIGAWNKTDGLNQVYRLTWDKIWAGSATPIPFHHNRNAAEEAEYKAWKAGNDAIMAQNEAAAPMLQQTIASMEKQITGELTGADAEREFILAVNKTFKTKSKMAQKMFFGMEGLTEEEIATLWGAPKSVRDFGGTRIFQYNKIIDTRATNTTYVPNVVVGNGQGIDPGYSEVTTQTGSLTECVMDLHLRTGGSKAGYRLVDFKGDLCVWDMSGFD